MLFFSAGTLRAQSGLQLRVGYSTAMPLGTFKDFMGKNSFRGYNGELSYPITERFRIGLGVSFSDYYEKFPRQTYQTQEGVISAVLTNSIQTTPIQVKANYDLTKEGLIRPYVGIGAGFNLVRFGQYYGEFGDANTSFKPAASADAGINIPFNRATRSAGINLGANFNYMPYNENGLKHLNNWGVHVGVFIPMK